MRAIVIATAICLSIVGLSAAQDAKAAMKMHTDIPAQGLGPALKAFAQARDLQVLYFSGLVKDLRTNGAAGELTAEEALTQLLSGTGLTYKYVDNKAVTIIPVSTASAQLAQFNSPLQGSAEGAGGKDSKEGDNSSSSFRVAQVDQTNAGPQVASEKKEKLDEIVVTGTHIRGNTPAGSAITILDRDYIDHSGYATSQQLLNTLPQNFTGGPNETLITGARNASPIPDGGGSINLRGLGATSTLVLLNGHRLAPSGPGSYVDISNIPLAALDRIEVLTDGASATYGADAVGGVVNFILRKNYQGAETRLRYGYAPGNALAEYQVGQLYGTTWSGGHLLADYEFNSRGALNVAAIPNTRDVPEPTDLLPKKHQHNVILSAEQELTDQLQLAADTYYQDRTSVSRENLFASFGGIPLENDTKTKAYGLNTRVTTLLASGWSLRLEGTFSRNAATLASKALPDETDLSDIFTRNSLWSIGPLADGTLFELPSGPVRVAVGGSYRHETLSSSVGVSRDSLGRYVTAEFAEIQVPVVGRSHSLPGLQRLDVTTSWRHERYSDFGSTSDPKMGMTWYPVSFLDVRSTYGRSFRAPTLFDVDSAQTSGNAAQLPDPLTTSGTSFVAFASGSNPTLRPETASTWTVGMDFKPPPHSFPSVNGTYFHTRYADRISTPFEFTVLTQPNIYGSIINRNPTPELIASVTSLPTFNNYSSLPLSDISVYIDGRLNNLGETTTDGVDLAITDTIETSRGKLSWAVAGTKIIAFDQRVAASAPEASILNTTYNPISFKGRATATWASHGWTLSASANYTGRYRDTTLVTNNPVASYTTIDTQVQCDLGELVHRSPLKGLVFTLTSLNLSNRHPPLIQDVYGVNFDQENANPLPRLLALEMRKSW